MKAALLILLIGLSSFASAQIFYVEPTEKGYEKGVIELMEDHQISLTKDSSKADYTIKCHVKQIGGAFAFEGFLVLSNKDGVEISRTKKFVANSSVSNMYSARKAICIRAYKKDLSKKVKKLLVKQ